VGSSRAWNFQQGSMAQWLPGLDTQQIVFNDFEEGKLVARIVDLESHNTRSIPWPVQSVHPSGRTAISLNYRRLAALRPDYGYSVSATNFSEKQPADRDGLWRVDLASGRAELVVTVAELMRRAPRTGKARHYVNHVLHSPTGRRIAFLHRWLEHHRWTSRLYICGPNGEDLRMLLEQGMVSHYCWRDDDHLLAYAHTAADGEGYYLVHTTTGKWNRIGRGVLDRHGDGHPGYSPDESFILTDTYPDEARQQRLVLYDVATDRCTELGRFLSAPRFDGPVRCDLHPRWSPAGNLVSIDSAHGGRRMSYVIDTGDLEREPSQQ